MPSIVSLVVIHCDLPTAGGAFRSGTVVGVVADDDGIVPGCLGGGVIVRVAADDDGMVPGCPGGGAPQSLAWCSTL